LELSHQRPVSDVDNERFTVQCLERGPAPFVRLVRLIFLNIFYGFHLADVFL